MVYLLICAAALAFKNYLCWYQAWLQLRTMMDTKFAGPLVAKAVTGKATEKELAAVHLAGFAGSVPPGRYDCQVTVLDPSGQKAAFWRVPIAVIP